MSQAARSIIGLLAALIVAAVIVLAIEEISAQVHPLPASIDVTDPESIRRALEAGQFPMIRLGLMVLGWWLAAYAGGTIAIRTSESAAVVWLFAIIATIYVFSELTGLPHPTWLWLAGVLGTPLFALGGGRQSLSMRQP